MRKIMRNISVDDFGDVVENIYNNHMNKTSKIKYKDAKIMSKLKLNKVNESNKYATDLSYYDYFKKHRPFIEAITNVKNVACPYCEIKKVEKTFKSRGAIDHMFPKEEYKDMQIALENLFLCCNTCNERKKDDPNFYVKYIASLNMDIVLVRGDYDEIIDVVFDYKDNKAAEFSRILNLEKRYKDALEDINNFINHTSWSSFNNEKWFEESWPFSKAVFHYFMLDLDFENEF